MMRLYWIVAMVAFTTGFLSITFSAAWPGFTPPLRPTATISAVAQNAEFLVRELRQLADDNAVMAQSLDRRVQPVPDVQEKIQ